MSLIEFYPMIGGNYKEVFGRIPSDAMIQKFVLKFLDDPTYQELHQAIALKDIQTAFRAAHTLKGIAYNLGFTALGDEASKLTELLRNADTLPLMCEIAKVDCVYEKTIEAIKECFK